MTESNLTAIDQLRTWFHYWNISEQLVKIDEGSESALLAALSRDDILTVSVSPEGELEIHYTDE